MAAIDGRTYFDEAVRYADWVEGYLTEANDTTRGTQHPQISVDFAGIDLWLRQWCERHPADLFVNAVTSFTRYQWGMPREE